MPFGKFTDSSGDELNRSIEGAIPLWLDLGARVWPELFLGAYGQYAFGFVGESLDDPCDASPDSDCSTSDLRLGLQVHYHPLPALRNEPWVGIGVGYEWLFFSFSGNGGIATLTTHGLELIQLQAGLDIEVADNFTLGPALAFSFGQYSKASADCSGAAEGVCSTLGTGSIYNRSLHHWLTLSIRAASH